LLLPYIKVNKDYHHYLMMARNSTGDQQVFHHDASIAVSAVLSGDYYDLRPAHLLSYIIKDDQPTNRTKQLTNNYYC